MDRGQKYDDESTRGGQKFLGENERGVILCGGVGPKDTHSTAATLFFVWSKDDSFFWQSSAVVYSTYLAELLFDTNFLTQIYLP